MFLSDEEIQAQLRTKDHSDAGYMAAEGRVRALPSASRAAYFSIPATALAGGAAYGLLDPEEDDRRM